MTSSKTSEALGDRGREVAGPACERTEIVGDIEIIDMYSSYHVY